MALRVKILSASGAVGNMLAAELLRENLLEAGDRLLLVGHGMDFTENGFPLIKNVRLDALEDPRAHTVSDLLTFTFAIYQRRPSARAAGAA